VEWSVAGLLAVAEDSTVVVLSTVEMELVKVIRHIDRERFEKSQLVEVGLANPFARECRVQE